MPDENPNQIRISRSSIRNIEGELMKERPRFQKCLFRYSLRKLVRTSDAYDRQLIQLALIDRTIFTMAYEQTMEELAGSPTAAFGFRLSRTAEGFLVVDNLLKLLDWFVQNGPTLIENLDVIAQLFGGIAATSAILRDEFDELENIAVPFQADDFSDSRFPTYSSR